MSITTIRRSQELLIADGSCPHIHELLATSQVPIFWLKEDEDPLSAVSKCLAKRRQQGKSVQKLHWVSHGDVGTLQIGGFKITTKTLLQAQQYLASWQVKEIALWSCSTGAEHEFISVLEEMTDAKIWASHQIIGKLDRDNYNWTLTRRNEYEAPVLPIDSIKQFEWNHKLGGFSSYDPISNTTPLKTIQEFVNGKAFAALKDDGSVVTWGDSNTGGDSSAVAADLSSGVEQIYSNPWAFAALKENGSVITWGNPNAGGDQTNFQNDLPSVANDLASGVTHISSTEGAFAALKEDGSVVTWSGGQVSQSGGDSSAVAADLSSEVVQISATKGAFAALKSDGSVVAWGTSAYGGNSTTVANSLTSGATKVYTNHHAFAALKDDGSVVTWGDNLNGGDSSAVAADLSSGVEQIFSNFYAFAALKANGSVITWGSGSSGSGGNSSSVASELSSGVKYIYANHSAFAALKDDGSVVTWGSLTTGGDSSAVAADLSSGVEQIFSNFYAFAAVKADGSVITWGSYGTDDNGDAIETTELPTDLAGVKNIYSNEGAFAALKEDGSVVTFGANLWGGDSSAVAGDLNSGVTEIVVTSSAFAALKSDGSVVTWGDSSSGGDSSAVSAELSSEVVGFANPFTNDVYDTTPPVLTSAATSTNGDVLILTYNEKLSATTATASDFIVTTDGASNVVTNVAISGSTVELTLKNQVQPGQAITVAYTDPSGSDDTNAIQDFVGNDAISFSPQSATNTSGFKNLLFKEESKNNSSTPEASSAGSNLKTSNPNSLILNSDNSFSVTKGSNLGLWVNLNVVSANALLQNSLLLVDQNNNILGAIGATQFSKNLGKHSIFIPQDSTFFFHQLSNNQSLQTNPQIVITDNQSGSFTLGLNDNLTDTDHDDLLIDISHSFFSPDLSATSMAAQQQQINDAILDLSSIPAEGQTLQITLNSDCSFNNRFALIRLTQESNGDFTVGGVSNTSGDAFEQAVSDNLINPGGSIIKATGLQQQTIEWTLSSANAGFYAPVLISALGDLHTYGSSHVKNLGYNFFAFEDDSLSSRSDWDFNDVSVLFEII